MTYWPTAVALSSTPVVLSDTQTCGDGRVQSPTDLQQKQESSVESIGEEAERAESVEQTANRDCHLHLKLVMKPQSIVRRFLSLKRARDLSACQSRSRANSMSVGFFLPVWILTQRAVAFAWLPTYTGSMCKFRGNTPM